MTLMAKEEGWIQGILLDLELWVSNSAKILGDDFGFILHLTLSSKLI